MSPTGKLVGRVVEDLADLRKSQALLVLEAKEQIFLRVEPRADMGHHLLDLQAREASPRPAALDGLIEGPIERASPILFPLLLADDAANRPPGGLDQADPVFQGRARIGSRVRQALEEVHDHVPEDVLGIKPEGTRDSDLAPELPSEERAELRQGAGVAGSAGDHQGIEIDSPPPPGFTVGSPFS